MAKIKRLNEKEFDFLTVGKLIEYLQTLDPSLIVGKSGHFGEFYPMRIDNFQEYKSFVNKINPYKYWVNDKDNLEEIEILDIYTPDIGEEPD